ncbi:hypothetical protein METBIDRAFT_31491 [Metschnikowia bicuspidata var. bicuspidata NRRL YB-4993]|uniref:Ricin B lectin domain-containing protein n=1 Tax=Metschnikowia bicuspidata var. bicuspidata NRRL YB-4993 TaxID=869754 RepID=A0A1A0HF60_9ASCO|nr:hypothetical protein METBIDRAFT_31491 [Metschnikowia bicuspidata var. bicuspidata NRRL YB-4993]OBA22620.1 hypothetical protein METBIDRAFT_31491 [Metschnikowia bicuspidata var. bicuspidata NRRL YB-4993]
MKLLATLPLFSLVLAAPRLIPDIKPLAGILSVKNAKTPEQLGSGFISYNGSVSKKIEPHMFFAEKGHVYIQLLGEDGQNANRLFMGLDAEKKLVMKDYAETNVKIIEDIHCKDFFLSANNGGIFQVCEDGLIGHNSGCESTETIEIQWIIQ